MIIQKGRFLVRYKGMDEGYIKNFDFENLENEYQKIKKFYLFKGDMPVIRICFLYSKHEALFFTGKEFESDWMCATTGYNTTINIYSPSVIEEYTIHKKECIMKTLVHELSHLFYGYSKFINLPLFNEGIARYLSNTECNNKINFEINSLKGGKDPKYDYGVGHLIICSIIEQFKEQGNKKLVEFLRQVSSQMEEKELFELFKKTFGRDVNILIKMRGGKNES